MERGLSPERRGGLTARKKLAALAIAAAAALGVGMVASPELRGGVAEFVDPMWPDGGIQPLIHNPTIER